MPPSLGGGVQKRSPALHSQHTRPTNRLSRRRRRSPLPAVALGDLVLRHDQAAYKGQAEGRLQGRQDPPQDLRARLRRRRQARGLGPRVWLFAPSRGFLLSKRPAARLRVSHRRSPTCARGPPPSSNHHILSRGVSGGPRRVCRGVRQESSLPSLHDETSMTTAESNESSESPNPTNPTNPSNPPPPPLGVSRAARGHVARHRRCGRG